MAKRVYEVDLSAQGIKDLIKILKDYEKRVRDCTERLVECLVADGLAEAKANNRNSEPSGEVGEFSDFTFIVNKPESLAVNVTIFYKGSQVAFIEFGAGVHWNGAAGTSPHAYGQELGYTIGSYGRGQGAKDGWYKPGGTYVHGTRAEMPMWKASQKIQRELLVVAAKVFENA